jgi:hypothetical protein
MLPPQSTYGVETRLKTIKQEETMLYKLSLVAALIMALAYSSAAFAQATQPPPQYYAPGVNTMYTGHHLCGANKKMAHCPMTHHSMGHHACGANKKMAHCMR